MKVEENKNFLLTNFQTHYIINPSSEGKHYKPERGVDNEIYQNR